jgi:hypothetical protein
MHHFAFPKQELDKNAAALQHFFALLICHKIVGPVFLRVTNYSYTGWAR